VSRIPIRFIIPAVIVFAVIGAFAVRNAHVDVMLMIFFGLVGTVLVATDYPMVSVVIGVIVGGFAEQGFVQGWLINRGNLVAFLAESSISVALVGLILFSLVTTVVKNRRASDTLLSG
jgi:putative tricarboxylic transport membrane protein